MSCRCKFSDYGKGQLRPYYPERKGFIVGESRDQSCWIVQWDGNRTSSNFHKSFIERDYDQVTCMIDLRQAAFLADSTRRLSHPTGRQHFDNRMLPESGSIDHDGLIKKPELEN